MLKNQKYATASLVCALLTFTGVFSAMTSFAAIITGVIALKTSPKEHVGTRVMAWFGVVIGILFLIIAAGLVAWIVYRWTAGDGRWC